MHFLLFLMHLRRFLNNINNIFLMISTFAINIMFIFFSIINYVQRHILIRVVLLKILFYYFVMQIHAIITVALSLL